MKVIANFLNVLPQNGISKTIGKLSKNKISKNLIKPYAKIYKIDTSEAELNIENYNSMSEFFTRKLKDNSRSFDFNEEFFCSPVDGTISQFGKIKDGKLVQAKNSFYSLKELTNDDFIYEKMKNGSFMTIYLSPKDYHRIHMPLNGTLESYSFIKGKLFPVNKIGINGVESLFTKNERIISNFKTKNNNNFSLVKIGAFIVGSIKVNYENGIDYKKDLYKKNINDDISFKKGDELGLFEFGSTVVLLFDENFLIDDNIKINQTIKLGEKLGLITN